MTSGCSQWAVGVVSGNDWWVWSVGVVLHEGGVVSCRTNTFSSGMATIRANFCTQGGRKEEREGRMEGVREGGRERGREGVREEEREGGRE